MANASSVSTSWVPEDDLLLKQSVETGASLEALAKGAVQFSRRFTFEELRDRWHTLVYDSEISAQASSRMFELELSGFNSSSKFSRIENFKGKKDFPEKRKSGCIRMQYYAMRKKFRSDFFNSTDLAFLDEPNHHCNGVEAHFQQHLTLDTEPQDGSSIYGNCISNNFRLQETDLAILSSVLREEPENIAATSVSNSQIVYQSGCPSSGENNNRNESDGHPSFQVLECPPPQPNIPMWQTMGDSSMPPVPISLSSGDTAQAADKMHDGNNGEEKSATFYDVDHSVPLLTTGHNNNEIVNATAAAESGDYMDLSFLNLSNEDGILLMDVEEKGNTNQPHYEDHNNVNSANDVQGDDVGELAYEIFKIAQTTASTSSVAITVEPVGIGSTDADKQIFSHMEVNVPPTSAFNSDSKQINEGNICCVLNTEDPEIPCNDDIFLLIHPSPSFTSSATQLFTKGTAEPSSTFNQRYGERGIILPLEERDFASSASWSHNIGSRTAPSPAHAVVGSAIKPLPACSSQPLIAGDAKKSFKDANHSRSLHAGSSVVSNKVPRNDFDRAELRVGDSLATYMDSHHAEVDNRNIVLSDSMVNLSTSDHEECPSDNDIPYFSDVEAMILDMDLEPHDHDPFGSRLASRYQFDDSKRTIMRLEQCVRSSLQRSLSSQGAFAVLYGRHTRHYIRKTEVILGRSTDDFDVDIDLRNEGRANKISRRQAIIKMEEDGSFSLKNLGKSSISVNGKVVAPGQSQSLSSSCLIEIRGMSFIFEINQRYVKRHLDIISKQNKGKKSKFEWSPNGET